MKRTIEKRIMLTEKENEDLKNKAKKAYMSESALIRTLIKGYRPREKPDDRFYDVCRELYSISDNLNRIKTRAVSLGFLDTQKLDEEIRNLDQFQLRLERQYLLPEKED